MRTIDGDLKKVQDELTEAKNSYNAISKGKASESFLQKDLGEVIYNSTINPDAYFVEKHHSENFSTLIYICHKAKVQQFADVYEKILEEGAVPKSLRYMELMDKDGFQIFRIVVLANKMDNYINEARK